MASIRKISLTTASIGFIMVFLLIVYSVNGLWTRNRITLDAPSYYTYLPALIIHHDLHLKYIDEDPAFYKNKVWYYSIEGGQRLIKHPPGLAVVLSPFFLVGHALAKITGVPQDGYSMPYQNAVSAGVLIWMLVGLLFLRRLLRMFYSERITALVLLTIVLGTNLLWYASFEVLMPHAISFSLLCICFYGFHAWLNDGSRKHFYLFVISFALAVLVRSLAITIALYFILYLLISMHGWKNAVNFLSAQLRRLITGAILFLLIISVQLLYWKYSTGHWLYDVYIDEHFVLTSPQMVLFLFSFRKGLFIYTPVLLFAIIGTISLYNQRRAMFWSLMALFIFTVYLLSSWWAWSYGICWGMRPMIDYYSVLAIAMGAGFTVLFDRGILMKVTSGLILAALIMLNLFQTWQYKNGLIHYDDMTRQAYFKGFLQTHASTEWYDLLKPYDWAARIKGEPPRELDHKTFMSSGKKIPFYFRGGNMLNVAVNPRAGNLVAAYSRNISADETFYIEQVSGDTITIRSSSGLLLTVNRQFRDAISATAQVADDDCKFIAEFADDDDNLFYLKALSGRYITVMTEFPYVLSAHAEARGQQEKFRFFIAGTGVAEK